MGQVFTISSFQNGIYGGDNQAYRSSQFVTRGGQKLGPGFIQFLKMYIQFFQVFTAPVFPGKAAGQRKGLDQNKNALSKGYQRQGRNIEPG